MNPSADRRHQVLTLRDIYREMATAPTAELQARISRELLQLLSLVSANSPWWTERLRMADKSPKTLEALVTSLPRTPKRLVQQEFTDMQVQIPGARTEDYALHKTSGSTGQPTRVRKLITSYFIEYDAFTLLEWEWQKRDINKVLGGFRIGEADIDDAPAGPPLTYIGYPPSQFSRSSLDHTPAQLLDAMVELRGSYVYSNGVTIRLVALEQIRNPRPGVLLEQFLSVSDRVDESLRDLVNQAFGAKICDRYSSEEFGYIALQCPVHNHLHVLSPSIYVEIVDENGQACDVGQPGKVLVTALHSFAQPLIRYEIGDIAQWGEPCAAGITWPVIENIMGRERQYLSGSDNQKRLVTFVGAEFLSLQKLLDFQVIRFADSIVMIVYVEADLDDHSVNVINDSLHSVFHTSDPVHIIRSENHSWRSASKRHEFDISSREFNPNWNVDLILDAIDR